MLKPKQMNIFATTGENSPDKLTFGISYVGMTKFKIKGNLRNKKNRKLRNYYDIKIGAYTGTDSGSPKIMMPVTATYTFSGAFSNKRSIRITSLKTGQAKISSPDNGSFKFVNQHKEVVEHFEDMGIYGNYADTYNEKTPTYYKDTLHDPNLNSYTCFCKQVGEDEIEVLAVMGMSYITTVLDRGTFIYAQDFLLASERIEKFTGTYNMFTMPICYKTLRTTGLISNTRFAARSVQRLDYCFKDQYIPWYAREGWGIVLFIVQIILWYIFPPAGAAATAASQTAAQAALQVLGQIAMNIAIIVAINIAMKYLAKLFGAEVAAVIGMVATVAMTAYGIGNSMGADLPYASQVMLVSPAIINSSINVLQSMQQNVQNMMKQEAEAYKEASKKLEEEQDYIHNYMSSDIDIKAFVAAMIDRAESLDDFITRTLETNFNKLADLEFLTRTVDRQLYIDYMPNLEDNWSGIPISTGLPENWEENLPENLKIKGV